LLLSQTRYRGFARGPNWGTSALKNPVLSPFFKFLDPPSIVKFWVRLYELDRCRDGQTGGINKDTSEEEEEDYVAIKHS